MERSGYLEWLAENTKTGWYHDSADPKELERGMTRRATGVTTNPVLVARALKANHGEWQRELQTIDGESEPGVKAEALMRLVVTKAARALSPEFERSEGRAGYVCSQVDPAIAGDRKKMLAMANRFHSWAPNVMVKLPATAAGLDVMEECTAAGIPVAVTVSFTVPQVVSTGERYRKAEQKAQDRGVNPGRCLAVIMIGRLDDYLRDVAHDCRARVYQEDIRQAGLAITKRAYELFVQNSYEATLIIAALRGTYHMVELAGGDLLMSIHPRYQEQLESPDTPREQRIERPVPSATLNRLSKIPEFEKAYEPDGMSPEEFITFGATQRTLSQFSEVGWKILESF
jgi:transaldolase